MKESEQLYALSVLFIPEVTYDYLNTDLTCVVLHPAGSDSVKVQLILGQLWVTLHNTSDYVPFYN